MGGGGQSAYHTTVGVERMQVWISGKGLTGERAMEEHQMGVREGGKRWDGEGGNRWRWEGPEWQTKDFGMVPTDNPGFN